MKIIALDFEQIGWIYRPNNEVVFIQSFDKVWLWIIDVVYNVSWAKYSWEDFSKKALVKDKGEDLKWRLVIFEVDKLEEHQFKELVELCYVH